MSPRAKLVSVAALVLAGLVLVPFPTRIAESTRLKVTRDDGSPLPGIRVNQEWESYGIRGEGRSSNISGSAGTVEFPRRLAYGGLGTRVLGRAFTTVAIHASYGSCASLEIELPSRTTDSRNWNLSAHRVRTRIDTVEFIFRLRMRTAALR